MKKAALACLLATGFLLPAEPDTPVEVVAGGAKAPPALCLESTADEVLRVCRAMLPVRPVELKGSLIRRMSSFRGGSSSATARASSPASTTTALSCGAARNSLCSQSG